MKREFPPQVLLRNITVGHGHIQMMEIISGMMKEGYSKGLVDPARIIVRADHAFLHFGDVHDAVRAQKHLHHYKLNHAILSAHLIVDENMVEAEEVEEPKSHVTLAKSFPMLSPVEKIEKKEKKEINKSGDLPHFNILDSILKGLDGCDDFLLENPVEVKKPVKHFCVECGFERSHTIQECPALRYKTRNSRCSYCLEVGHILFAKYPGKKELVCPVAIAKGGAFKY
jgi:hypothetical protein